MIWLERAGWVLFALVALLAVPNLAVLAHRSLVRLTDAVESPARDSWPRVSVIVAARNEQLLRLREAIRGLRDEEQEVFLLRQNGQLKYEEIAEAAGIPLGTVKTRMRLALTKLREALAEEE